MELRLEAPRPEHRQLVETYRREFLNSGDSIDGSAGLAWCSGFDEWMALLADNSRDETARPGCVATSVLLAFDGPELVGMVDIRHRLNDYLRRYCGHIGYSVRPALRRRGYATAMLTLALEECRRLGLSQVMLTCEKTNVASARTMLHCGAVLQDELLMGSMTIQRYWIEL